MWVKICGIRTVEEANAVMSAGPDAIGLNFFTKSKRYVQPEIARSISDSAPEPIEKVGVFVDDSPAEIRKIAQQAGLTQVQLHGDYTPADAEELQDLSLIWVHRLDDGGFSPLWNNLEELQVRNINLFACLVDASAPGLYGGSGHTVDWNLVAREYDQQKRPRLILAGGLKPDNVTEAISVTSPWGVDTASGVESDGLKNAILCKQFVENARS